MTTADFGPRMHSIPSLEKGDYRCWKKYQLIGVRWSLCSLFSSGGFDARMTIIKHRPGALWAIVSLLFVTVFCMVLRTVWSSHGGVVTGDSVWKVTLDFDFQSESEGAEISLAQPVDTAHARVVGQNYFYPGLRQARMRKKTDEPRDAVFLVPRKGRFHFRADFQVHFTPGTYWERKPRKAKVSPEARENYLGDGPGIQTKNDRIQNMVYRLSAQHPEKKKLVEATVDFCERKIAKTSGKGAPDDAAAVLAKRKASTLGRARLMIALCRAGKIPARLVTGFLLKEDPAAQLHYWVETFLEGRWIPFDPENGHRQVLPAHFVPVRQGGYELLGIDGVSHLSAHFSVTHIPTPKGVLGDTQENLLEIIDLTRLPLSTQNSLIILLLLPAGALLTTFFRNVIGITTFGTFTPTLLALATLYADWRTAVVLFLVVVVIGIGGRSLLPGLKLMRVPRLSIVFTLVAFIMTFTLSAMEYFNFTPAGHVVLLPLVVLTTIIDRVYTLADEDGMHTALLRLFWTIVVALCCITIFRWQSFGRLLLIYPELHFSTLALMVLFGLYNAPRLMDIPSLQLLTEKRKDTKKGSRKNRGDHD